MRKKIPARKPIALAILATISSWGFPALALAEMKGNIGVFSKYVLRGITNNTESDSPVVQGGFDYAHANGIYAGYWGSNVDYGNVDTATGFENDFYIGYAGKAGSMTYDLSLIQYYYIEVEDSNGMEVAGELGFGPVVGSFKYLANDVAWGNTGDIYWALAYSTALPKDFTFGATLGYYTYNDDDAGNDKAAYTTTTDGEFRHLDLTLSHPIAQTGANMSLTYIIGGKDRSEVDQKDAMVLGLSYAFNI